MSKEDREVLEQYGAAVVEASWNRIEEVPFARIGGKCERLCMFTLDFPGFMFDVTIQSL